MSCSKTQRSAWKDGWMDAMIIHTGVDMGWMGAGVDGRADTGKHVWRVVGGQTCF